MAKNKISMPTSSAGITRYFDDYKSKIVFKPGHIIFLAIFVMLIVLMLHMWGSNLIG
jgi:preprotein translocase subunit Sec61beta